MPRRLLPVLLILFPFSALAESAFRYVSDELAVTVREGPSAGSPNLGVLTSGARVELLASDPDSGYARVRMADGREGWIVERYLSREPIARERLQRAERELAELRSELKALQDNHAKLRDDYAKVTAGHPPPAPEELVRENATLHSALEEYERERERVMQQYDVERETQNTLMLGGLLVGGGFVLALLIVWLAPRRKRWSDL